MNNIFVVAPSEYIVAIFSVLLSIAGCQFAHIQRRCCYGTETAAGELRHDAGLSNPVRSNDMMIGAARYGEPRSFTGALTAHPIKQLSLCVVQLNFHRHLPHGVGRTA